MCRTETENIQVRFYELDDDENVVWEDFGKFAESDVHHQYAIALRTPPYHNRDIETKVQVFVQLFRKSDHCFSASLPFHYKPRSSTVTRKRARMASAYNSAELPTVLQNASVLTPLSMHGIGGNAFAMDTISTEFNKSDIINQLLTKSSEESLLRYVMENTAEFEHMMDDDTNGALQTDDGRIAMTVCDGGGGGGGNGAAANAASRIEMRVTLLRQQIDRVARTQSKKKAKDYLENMWSVANTRVE